MKKAKNVAAEVVTPSVVVDKAGQSTDQVVVSKPDVSLYLSSVALNVATVAIKDYSSSIAGGFVGIGLEFSKLSKNPKTLTDCGYSDVYDYGEKVFGFKKTSVKNFIGVYDRFGDKNSSRGCIDDKYDDYSFTQLVELLPVSDVSSYKPDMTVKEIRDKKVLDRVASEKSGLEEYLLNGLKAMVGCYDKPSVSKSEAVRYGCDYSFVFSCVAGGFKVSGSVSYSLSGGFSFGSDLAVGRSHPYDFDHYFDFVSLSKRLASLIKEGIKEAPDLKKAREAAKREKPEWQLWHEMGEADKKRSLSPDGVRDSKLHPFFVSRYLYPDGGVVSAGDYCASFKAFCTFAFDADKKMVTDRVIDVVYLWRGDAGEILSCHGSDASALVAFLDSWCDSQLALGKGGSR